LISGFGIMTTTIRRSAHRIIHALACSLLLAPLAVSQAALDDSLLAGLKARNIGPATISGRIAAIDAVASDPNRIVIGAATGGVWISDNGGLTWEPVFDDQPVASIGALAINQSNPDIIWVGTGESNVRNSTSIGGGIYKSIDGGKTWSYTGLGNSERIDRITLHPHNPDIAYVAALGTLWAPNEERGVYKTTDGGKTWQRILYVDDTTGATDLKMDPSNPDKLYAGMWQFRRWPYQFKSGGPGSGMYISNDGGASWQRKTEEDGLPKGELGRMVFAISPAAPKRVYALVEAEKSALLVSENGGDSWQKVNEEYNVADRPFYYSELAVDPQNPLRVYNIATRVRVSIDGGKTFEYIAAIDCCAPGNTIHIDNHAYWINPADSRHMIVGNDGGIAITHDRGDTWRFVRNLSLAQFYHVAVDNAVPYNVYGGLQDNGSWRGPSEVMQAAGIQNLHWEEVGFGDGFDTQPDPENPRAGYTMSQGGALSRWNLDTGEQRYIRPNPPTPDTDLRFNWNAGFAQDPFDPATIYYGSQFLHKSTDLGESWSTISGDLTSNNPDVQKFRESGGLTFDVTAAENYTTIVSVAPSKLERNLLWVGTDDGRVHVTRDGGANWQRVDERARGVPQGAWVPMISPSPHDPAVAFVVFDDHRRGNMNTYVYRVSDYGRRWESLGKNNLSGYALSVLQDPVDPQLLFLGTEFGLFISNDGGDSWSKFTNGVPTVSVMDMAIQEREHDLVLGTHGRSIYVIDDYRALRRMPADTFSARLKILSASEGQQYDDDMTRSTRFTGAGEFRGGNEPYGVMLTFAASGDDLTHPDEDRDRERRIRRRQASANTAGDAKDAEDKKKDEAPKIEVKVLDNDGEVIRTYRTAVHQGINRITWDMRRDGSRSMPGAEEADYTDGLPAGPEVPPGTYRIQLTLKNGDTDTRDEITAVVVHDPRSPYSQADIEQNYRARLELLEMTRRNVAAVERIVTTRDDVKAIKKRVAKREDSEQKKALNDAADAAIKRLDELEKLFRVPPQTKGIVYDDDKVSSHIGTANYYVSSTLAPPSPAARVFVDIARLALDKAVAESDRWFTDELPKLKALVDNAGIGFLTRTTAN
jgi:photosystem II stability/assembly factor-like uncharacterized protein